MTLHVEADRCQVFYKVEDSNSTAYDSGSLAAQRRVYVGSCLGPYLFPVDASKSAELQIRVVELDRLSALSRVVAGIMVPQTSGVALVRSA